MASSTPNLITAAQLAAGYVISASGAYALEASTAPELPVFPTTSTWNVWFEARPCVLRIDANDVTLDLQGHTLAVANDQVQHAVLVGVTAGLRNVAVRNGTLDRSAIALFFALGCQTVAASGLAVQEFAEAGILAYAPQGLAISNVTIGPNLTSLAVSQETYALQTYGAAVSAVALAAWIANPDNLAVQEVSHLTGLAIVPNAAGDSPNYPTSNTSTNVVLTNVTVVQLQMYYREHSMRFGLLNTSATQVAVGSFDDALAEAYTMRLQAAKTLGVGFVPALDCAPHPHITYANGFSINTEDDSLAARTLATTWARGVDRDGQAIRGAQAILLVGCGDATLTAVTAAIPNVTMLPPRVSNSPGGCQTVNLLVSTRGLAIVNLEAATATACCSANTRPAGYFSKYNATTFSVQPTSTYSAVTNGSYIRL